MIDSLKLAQQLAAGGLTAEQTSALASAVYGALKENNDGLATTTDLEALEAKMKSDIERAIHAQTKWIVATILVVGGFLVAAIKLPWPL